MKVGETINKRYRIVGNLGSGGLGDVFHCEDLLDHHRPVAVKCPKAERGCDSLRFVLEADTQQKLQHAHVLEFLDFGMPSAGPAYLVTELMRGGSLKDLCEWAQQQNAPEALSSGIPRPLAVELMRQCADGLAYLHGRDIAHRDLKPANLLLDRPPDVALSTGQALLKIADFGIASTLEQDRADLTQDGSFIGTYPFAAPEYLQKLIEYQALCNRGGSPEWEQSIEERIRGDLFAFGLLLYQLWTGRPLLESGISRSGNHLEKLQKHYDRLIKACGSFQGTPPSQLAFDPILPLIRSMLDVDPLRRTTAAEVKGKLSAMGEPIIVIPYAPPEAPRRAQATDEPSAPAQASRSTGPLDKQESEKGRSSASGASVHSAQTTWSDAPPKEKRAKVPAVKWGNIFLGLLALVGGLLVLPLLVRAGEALWLVLFALGAGVTMFFRQLKEPKEPPKA